MAPGIIDSELTRGKFMSKDGELIVDKEMRDVQISLLPVESAETCAKAVVKSVCGGEKYMVEPSWVGSIRLWRVFCPELIGRLSCWLLITEPTVPPTEAPSKKILDLAKTVESVFSP